jgi:choice-of-anchor C domain-containing protein
MRIRHGLAAACTLWLSTLATAQAGLITNGSFEDGVDPGKFITLHAGSTNLTGWEITHGNVDYIGYYWQASDGVRSVDLDGLYTAGRMAQNIATVVGEEYELTFDLSGNPDGPPDFKWVRAGANGQFADFSFDATNSTHDDMGWLPQSWRFVADSDVTTIWFQSLSEPTNSFGAAIDNVAVNHVARVADTPEPSGLALCLVGTIGVGFWRRGR